MKERLLALRELFKKIPPRVRQGLIYVFGVYAPCFVLFCSWTFPYARLKDRFVSGFNSQQRASGSKDELSIDDMSSYLISGVKMKGIKLTGAPAEAGKAPSEMKIDEVRARVSLLPLLVGNRDIGFRLLGFGGKIEGDFDDHGEKEKSVEAKLSDIDVSQFTPLVELIGLPLEGTLSGTVKIAMPEGKSSKASGSVSLELGGLSVGDGKAKLKGAFALPKVNVGNLALTADAKDGVLRITKLGASGKDVEIQGEGRVVLRELAMESNCDLNIRFKINDAYRNKSDVTKSLFGAPGSNAPPLFELADPRVKQSKRADGFYGWRARGMLAHLDFQPAAGGGGGGGGGLPGMGGGMGMGAKGVPGFQPPPAPPPSGGP